MYTLDQYANNFASILGVDVSDNILLDDIFKFLANVKNIEDFRQFVINELSEKRYLSEYEYKNATIKLYILFGKYKEIEFKNSNKSELQKAQEFVEKLYKKIKLIYTIATTQQDLELEKFIYKDTQEQLFNQNEQKIINKFGGLLRVTRLSEDKDLFIYTLLKANEVALKTLPQPNRALQIANRAVKNAS